VKVLKQENKVTYEVQNLSCANCAKKIEKRINEIDGVSEASIDIINKRLTFNNNSNKNNEDLLKEMNKIADSVEPGTKFVEVKKRFYEHEEETNEKTILIRLIIGGILFILGYIFEHLNIYSKAQIILFIVSYVLIGYEVIYKAIRNMIKGNLFDENFLMSIATIAAIYVRSYPEAVAVMLFYEVGEYFQDRALDRSRESIRELVAIQPKVAYVKEGTTIKEVHPAQVNINDVIVIKPGDLIPLDGIVISGTSEVDTSKLTGESLPRTVEPNSEVLAGYINYNGLLEVKVTKIYEDSAVSKILELVENAQSKKAKVEKWITKFARIYTPIVILLAILITFVPMAFVENYVFNDYLYRGATFLVVSCPCALVISIPLSIFGGIGASSRAGILIKGGNYLEILRDAKIMVFDKTGTITKGNFVVTKVVTYDFDETELVNLTVSAEKLSNHAIGKAIAMYKEINQDEYTVEDYEEIFGKGIKARIKDNDILIGNKELMLNSNIEVNNEIKETGTLIYVAINGRLSGYFVISDEVKNEAKEAISLLKRDGIEQTIMLTGDNFHQANAVAKKVGIDKVYAELLPEDKLTVLEQLKKEYPDKFFIYVGDGVNDTPVLTASDIGISMGALGSDAAIETSDVVIMNDNLKKLYTARQLAKLTHKKIWQNIIFALSVKVIVLILSGLGYASMWMAVFSDVGVALLAILNSVLILRYKENKGQLSN